MRVTQVVLELLTACNFKCPYCRDNSGSKDSMSVEMAQTILMESSALGIRKAQFDGGEPFLYPEIRSLIEFGLGKGIQIGLYSNAALVDAELARFLAERPTLKIAVTLHAINPRGDLEASFQGLQALRAVGIFPQLIVVVSDLVLPRLPSILERIPDLGYTVVLNPLVLSGRAFDNAMAALTRSGREQLANLVAKVRSERQRTKIVDNASVEEEVLEIGRIQMNDEDEFALHVNTDGQVLPFFSADPSTAIGNVKDIAGLRKALNDAALDDYLRRCQLAMKRRVHGRDGASSRRIRQEDVASAHSSALAGAIE